MANECLTEVNERTAFPLTVSFLDEDSLPVTPTSATYRIDDEASKTAILPVTNFPTLDDTVDLWITSDQNFIVKPRKPFEIRTVTVQYVYESENGPTPATAQYRYKLVNLYGVVDVPSASLSPSASASPSV
jgi:hypothetical protein